MHLDSSSVPRIVLGRKLVAGKTNFVGLGSITLDFWGLSNPCYTEKIPEDTLVEPLYGLVFQNREGLHVLQGWLAHVEKMFEELFRLQRQDMGFSMENVERDHRMF